MAGADIGAGRPEKKKKKSKNQIALNLSKSVSGLICSQKISCYDTPAE